MLTTLTSPCRFIFNDLNNAQLGIKAPPLEWLDRNRFTNKRRRRNRTPMKRDCNFPRRRLFSGRQKRLCGGTGHDGTTRKTSEHHLSYRGVRASFGRVPVHRVRTKREPAAVPKKESKVWRGVHVHVLDSRPALAVRSRYLPGNVVLERAGGESNLSCRSVRQIDYNLYISISKCHT